MRIEVFQKRAPLGLELGATSIENIKGVKFLTLVRGRFKITDKHI